MSGIVKLINNPECSKSRAVLQLLRENNAKPEVIEYLKVSISKEIIEDILHTLGKEPQDIIGKNDDYFIINKLGNKKLNT